jgi:hypothetical protein
MLTENGARFTFLQSRGKAARGTAWKPMLRYLYLKILTTAASKDGLSVPI